MENVIFLFIDHRFVVVSLICLLISSIPQFSLVLLEELGDYERSMISKSVSGDGPITQQEDQWLQAGEWLQYSAIGNYVKPQLSVLNKVRK